MPERVADLRCSGQCTTPNAFEDRAFAGVLMWNGVAHWTQAHRHTLRVVIVPSGSRVDLAWMSGLTRTGGLLCMTQP